jgi:hypothetical protein
MLQLAPLINFLAAAVSVTLAHRAGVKVNVNVNVKVT